jgi:hypothetical protein
LILLPGPRRTYSPPKGGPLVTDAQPGTEPVIVRLPAEIDIANAEDVGEQLRSAFTPASPW